MAGRITAGNFAYWIAHYRGRVWSRKTFIAGGASYRYFIHPYNYTWGTERSVEIPIFIEAMGHHAKAVRLEIGNVLSHYFAVGHTVVDKHEQARGVVGCDILDFTPGKRYDLIISISTLEHVGYAECAGDEHKDDEAHKAGDAVHRIRQLLTPHGMGIVSVPVGFNPWLDNAVREGRIGFDKCCCLIRTGPREQWVECGLDRVLTAAYGEPHPNANGIIIGRIYRDAAAVNGGTRHADSIN